MGVWLAGLIACTMMLAPPVRAQSKAFGPPPSASSLAQIRDLKSVFGSAFVDEDHSLEVDPNASVGDKRQTLLRRAALYEEMKEFAKAEGDWTTAVKLDPPMAILYGGRGYFYMRTGRLPEALADFISATRIDPADPRFIFAAGRVQTMLGNYAEAVSFYGDAIKLAARDPNFYLARAEAFIHLEQLDSARSDYDRALELRLQRPVDRYFAYVGRGYVALKLADYSSAMTDFDKALDFDPYAVTVLLWRGYAHEKGGHVDLALDDYERAVSADPKDRWARANLQRLRSN
jgi:tetratricopeptide (TPR) repeat protein